MYNYYNPCKSSCTLEALCGLQLLRFLRGHHPSASLTPLLGEEGSNNPHPRFLVRIATAAIPATACPVVTPYGFFTLVPLQKQKPLRFLQSRNGFSANPNHPDKPKFEGIRPVFPCLNTKPHKNERIRRSARFSSAYSFVSASITVFAAALPPIKPFSMDATSSPVDSLIPSIT